MDVQIIQKNPQQYKSILNANYLEIWSYNMENKHHKKMLQLIKEELKAYQEQKYVTFLEK